MLLGKEFITFVSREEEERPFIILGCVGIRRFGQEAEKNEGRLQTRALFPQERQAWQSEQFSVG